MSDPAYVPYGMIPHPEGPRETTYHTDWKDKHGNPREHLWNALVGCEHVTQGGPGGGIVCNKCGGWFCY
jgi:hypothetical protein